MGSAPSSTKPADPISLGSHTIVEADGPIIHDDVRGLTVPVQAKHWQPEPPVGKEVIDQLIRGIEAESANLGMVITSGTVSEEAVIVADQYSEEKGIRIELVDGEQFAKLIVEHGIKVR